MLTVGTEAPDFTAQDQDSQPFTLSDRQGAWTLIWWYPKASTPG
jgi:peroxiredoxin Q/BCP